MGGGNMTIPGCEGQNFVETTISPAGTGKIGNYISIVMILRNSNNMNCDDFWSFLYC